ncbi:MAG: hypothetical protein ACRC1T_05335 [Clostridium chrysemydis]|uniref:hypothetical protein n=1 Tax=Clostridium chrysemydis TaxID=2665504 RepID=UPI003F3CBCEA
MYYTECSDCNREIDQDNFYNCSECGKIICFHCYINGDSLCEECFKEENNFEN